MSAYLDLTAANAGLKEYYDGQVVENEVYEDNPALAMVPKKTDSGGKYIPVPIITGVSQGRSSTFTTAQANQSPVQIQEFLLTRKSDYSIATIDNQTLLAANTDKKAFIDTATVLVDGAIRSATLSATSSLFRAGTGSIAQVHASTAISSGVITLLNASDAVQFEINMVLQANSTDGGTPRAALGYVIAVSRTGGTVTVSATAQGGAAGTPSGWTTSDYLLVQGDNNAKLSGLAAWLPASAPSSSDNFYGVNRSVDARLYGISFNGAGQSVEEALIDHSMLVAREGGKPDHYFTNFGSYGAVLKALGAKVQYVDLKGPADISFRGVMLNGANSMLKVLPDRSCQPLTGWMLTMKSWTLHSLNPVPSILRYSEGNDMLRVYNADAAECRVGSYANLATNAPGWNGQTTLGA